MRLLSYAAVLSGVLSSPVLAAPGDVAGIGAKPCRFLVENKKFETQAFRAAANWSQGFVSSLQFHLDTDYRYPSWDKLNANLKIFCINHPDRAVGAFALQVWEQMESGR